MSRYYRHRNVFMVFFAFLMTFTLSFLLAQTSPSVTAANARNFKPGNIISNYVMSNSKSMTVSEINKFLHSKNPCNDTNLGKVSQYRDRFTYHIKDGHFVCLADETFDGKTTAQVIYDVAQEYQINPQVLIVLLEKEQSLVTDTYPYQNQILYALGYGCFDDAQGCRPQYAGFKKQLSFAAALFREVLNGGWSNYHVGNNYIQYHPNSNCKGTTVYIENLATASLYRYTPYQPNQAALNAGYGVGDSCSSYGNRNFYLLFSDWFGNPIASATSAPASKYTTRPVADGEYYIVSALDNAKSIDIQDAQTKNGANIQLYTKWGATNVAQRWKFTWNESGKYYTIANIATGRVLDITGASMHNGTNIQLYDNNNTCAQRWHFKKENGHITILNACNEDYVIDVTGASTADHTNIQLYRSNGTKAQQWKLLKASLRPFADGSYVISSTLDKEKVLDLQDVTTKNYANIQLYTRWGDTNTAQQWKLTYDQTKGYYTITNIGSNYTIDLDGAWVTNGSNIQLYYSNNTCAQHWFLTPNPSGYYSFVSACNEDYVIDVTGASNADHTNIQLYRFNGTKAQQWKLTKL